MDDNVEALELIENARRKARSLYASDKIASPLFKSINLIDRIVNGEAHDSNLEGDVRRLIDDADYTREREVNREDPLRSIIIDVCKLIGFATRAISSRNAHTTKEPLNEASSRPIHGLAHIPKEEPGISQIQSTTIRVDAVPGDDITASLESGENLIFTDGRLFPDTMDDKETVITNLHFTPFDDQTVKTEVDDWQIDPSYDPIHREDELPQPPERPERGKRRIDDTVGTSSSSKGSAKRQSVDLSFDNKEEEEEAEEEHKDDDEDEEDVAFLCEKNPKRVNYYGNFDCQKCKKKYTTRKTLFMHSFVHNKGPVQMFLDETEVIRRHEMQTSELEFSRMLFDRVRLPTETKMRLEDRDRDRIDFVYECFRKFKEPDPKKLAAKWKFCVYRYNYNVRRRSQGAMIKTTP